VQVQTGFPPNITEILKRFKVTDHTVYAYGDILYNPTGLEIPQDLMVHEEVHQKQQNILGVEQWWAMYLENKQFRLNQEVEAYRAQYEFLKTVFNRHSLRGALQQLAQNLSSPLYGSIITKKEAQNLIS
jgi:hypothetical protein